MWHLYILIADFAAPMYIVLVCCWLVNVCLCVCDSGVFVAQAKHLHTHIHVCMSGLEG